MRLPLFIARRYLFARKSHNVINVISAISAAGMAIGTAALILILSVYNGFDSLLKQNLGDLDPATTTVLKPSKNDSIYITIRFKKPTALEGMLLLNGYTKNAETYRNNARIDSLMVFGDYNSIFRSEKETISQQEKNMLLAGERDYIIKYTGVSPTSFDWQSLVDNAMIVNLSDEPWVDNCYTEIRIVITAAAKGLKYQDLCLSEILLIGK